MKALSETAQGELFQESVMWQNRKAVRGSIASLKKHFGEIAPAQLVPKPPQDTQKDHISFPGTRSQTRLPPVASQMRKVPSKYGNTLNRP